MFYRLKQFILFVGDLVSLYLGLYFGVTLRYLDVSAENFLKLFSPFTTPFFVATVIMFIIGLYDVGRARNTWKFFQKIILTGLIWFLFSVLFFYSSPNATISPKTTLFLTTVCGFGILSLWRFTYNRFLSTNLLLTPIAFVGLTKESAEIIDIITKYPEKGYVMAGIIGTGTSTMIPTAPTLQELLQINNGLFPGLIVLSPEAERDSNILKELYGAIFMQTSVLPLAEFYESFFQRIPPFTFSEAWFISHLKEQTRKIYDRFRIIIDFLLAFIMGIVFIITYPIIAIAIKISSSGPILFNQERVGRGGQIFKIHKYRTMKSLTKEGSAETGGPEYAKEKDNRITSVGLFLRKTRIDELPQFINILRGEMALIGPRPERPEFVEELIKNMPFYSLRHLVKPGLTGWAQLQKSYYGSIEENLVKLEYDLYYVKNRNFLLDVIIILRTISVLVRFMGR